WREPRSAPRPSRPSGPDRGPRPSHRARTRPPRAKTAGTECRSRREAEFLSAAPSRPGSHCCRGFGRARRPTRTSPRAPRSRRACGRRACAAASAPPRHRSRPTPDPRSARGRAADDPSPTPLLDRAAKIADAETSRGIARPRAGRVGLLAALVRFLDRDDRALGEEILTEVAVEDRIVAPHPLEDHGRVLFLLVTVVREDLRELLVVRRVDALGVPIDGFEFLHQGADRPVAVDDGFAQRFAGFVQDVRFAHIYRSFVAGLLLWTFRCAGRRPTRLLLPSRGAPPSPLELHIPTLRCVRKPERPREDRDRNEQAETCIDRDADGRLRHRGSSTWARRSGKQLLCRTSTAAEPAAEQIPAEHP